MVKYVFRDGPQVIRNAKKADPQKIGEAVEKARAETAAGDDMREKLVEAARGNRHPLHKHFEWDDTIAGHKFRLEQANDLIRIVAVENEDGEKEPAFIKIVPAKGGGGFYSPSEVRQSVDLQSAALLAAERDLRAFELRHRVLVDICAEVRKLREKVRHRRERATGESRADAA